LARLDKRGEIGASGKGAAFARGKREGRPSRRARLDQVQRQLEGCRDLLDEAKGLMAAQARGAERGGGAGAGLATSLGQLRDSLASLRHLVGAIQKLKDGSRPRPLPDVQGDVPQAGGDGGGGGGEGRGGAKRALEYGEAKAGGASAAEGEDDAAELAEAIALSLAAPSSSCPSPLAASPGGSPSSHTESRAFTWGSSPHAAVEPVGWAGGEVEGYGQEDGTSARVRDSLKDMCHAVAKLQRVRDRVVHDAAAAQHKVRLHCMWLCVRARARALVCVGE